MSDSAAAAASGSTGTLDSVAIVGTSATGSSAGHIVEAGSDENEDGPTTRRYFINPDTGYRDDIRHLVIESPVQKTMQVQMYTIYCLVTVDFVLVCVCAVVLSAGIGGCKGAEVDKSWGPVDGGENYKEFKD